MAYEGRVAVYSGVDDKSESADEGHLHLDTVADQKNVRINSRDYIRTSGDQCAVQIKPNMSVTGEGGITGLEVSPRFAEGCAGAKCVGIMSNPILKGDAGGDLSSAMRCYEGKLESDSGSTRTLAEAYVLHAMQALHGTVTDGPWVLKVDAHGGNVVWAGFGVFPDDDQIAAKDDASHSSQAGWIKVKIGDTVGYIPFNGA